jgi:hypothetical protein
MPEQDFSKIKLSEEDPRFINAGLSRNFRQVAQIMGDRLILPAEFPPELQLDVDMGCLKQPDWMRPELFESKCRLANTGANVGDTHYLFVLPASIAGRPLTVNNVLSVANQTVGDRTPLFYKYNRPGPHKWFENSPVGDMVLSTDSKWILLYESPFLIGKQRGSTCMPDYCLAGLGAVATCLFANLLLRDRRVFANGYGAVQETCPGGQRIDIGLNLGSGARIWFDDQDPERSKMIGQALMRV